MQRQNRRIHGFTLIELSIVLVIIGLVVGGILVGREMIASAQIRKAVSQIDEYRTRVHTFRVKYNCLPGDCARASQFGLGSNGNGDGVVRTSGNDARCAGGNWPNCAESVNFWYHMWQAGLLEVQVTGYTSPFTQMTDYYPALKGVDNTVLWAYTLQNGQFQAGIELGNNILTTAPSTAAAAMGATLSAAQTYGIDNKIDDGKPGTGQLRSYGAGFPQRISNYSDDLTVCAAGPAACTLNFCGGSPNEYNFASSTVDTISCGFSFLRAF